MTEYPYDASAYERRYRRVYEAGAEFWEKPIPTEALVSFLAGQKVRNGARAVDLGCGEGRDSIFLAKKGFKVLGIDASRSGMRRTKERLEKEKATAELLMADVTNLPVKNQTFDLAVNVGCLHMITVQAVRDRHLRESYRVLQKHGTYFSCNLGIDESLSVKELYRKLGTGPGALTQKKIEVHGRETEIDLPIIAAWPKSKDQYVKEFEKSGFKIATCKKVKTEPVGECWMLVALKDG